MKGFWKSPAYIAAQYPLEETTQDFWRMVWQENCRSLVMLLSKEELEQVIPYRPHPPPPQPGRGLIVTFLSVFFLVPISQKSIVIYILRSHPNSFN